MWNDLEQTNSSLLKDEDFQALQNFPHYSTVEDDLMTSSTRTLDEMICDGVTVENANRKMANLYQHVQLLLASNT